MGSTLLAGIGGRTLRVARHFWGWAVLAVGCSAPPEAPPTTVVVASPPVASPKLAEAPSPEAVAKGCRLDSHELGSPVELFLGDSETVWARFKPGVPGRYEARLTSKQPVRVHVDFEAHGLRVECDAKASSLEVYSREETSFAPLVVAHPSRRLSWGGQADSDVEVTLRLGSGFDPPSLTTDVPCVELELGGIETRRPARPAGFDETGTIREGQPVRFYERPTDESPLLTVRKPFRTFVEVGSTRRGRREVWLREDGFDIRGWVPAHELDLDPGLGLGSIGHGRGRGSGRMKPKEMLICDHSIALEALWHETSTPVATLGAGSHISLYDHSPNVDGLQVVAVRDLPIWLTPDVTLAVVPSDLEGCKPP